MLAHDRAIARVRVALATILALKYALALATGWAFAWGIVVLAVRALTPAAPGPLLWGLAAVPVIVAVALSLALRKLPSAVAVRALLDQRSSGNGLLMAAGERALNGWEAALPEVAEVRVSWRGGRAWALFAAAVVFLAVSFLLPQPFIAPAAARALEIGKEAAKLDAQIEVLKEEAALEPQRAEDLRQKLRQLKDEASGEAPVKTLEGLDHLAGLAKKAADEAAEAAVKQTEKLSKAETLAEALRESGGDMDARRATEAMKELAAMLSKAAEESKALEKHLDAETLKACRAGKLSAEQLKKIAAALRGGKKALAEGLKRLREAELIDADKLRQCDKAGECHGGALAKFLKENSAGLTLEEMLMCCQEGGRGGVDEGGGPTALTWKDATTADGAKFKEEALPPADLAALKASQLTGISQTKPPTKSSGGQSEPGALRGAAVGGGSAPTQVILPRHRGAVRRYFDRPADK